MDNWKKSEYFCPCCGKQTMWTNIEPTNYCLDNIYICLKCETGSYLDGSGSKPLLDDLDAVKKSKYFEELKL